MRLPDRPHLVRALCCRALVLPLIGEDFAGSKSLSLAGMAAFAAIHTVFFLLLAGFHQRVSPALFTKIAAPCGIAGT